MENSPSSSSPSPPLPPPPPSSQSWIRVSEMDILPQLAADESSVWDWGDLLEFTTDDLHFSIPAPSPPLIASPEASSDSPERERKEKESDRVRKRDPRSTCSNFLAGRVPCACPETDALLKEEEEGGAPGNKRPRTSRAGAGAGIVRCQVPGCEADIRELKGYHRRHRVCLRCAAASTVHIDGQNKRYCQQCGKFHILSDFDEGKRSCRRKLERHNNRRRRKPSDSKSPVTPFEKESQVDTPAEDNAPENDVGKESLCLNNQIPEREVLLEPEDVCLSTPCSMPLSKNTQNDCFESLVQTPIVENLCLNSQVTEREVLLEPKDVHLSTLCSVPVSENTQNAFLASGDAQVDGGIENSRCTLSSVYCDDKSAYSSMCPTGRISFKLYDWNPAEFPRRLRHQIFQWLATMPVELEGYIRPGCTILTAFVAMPKLMWVKLYEDPDLYLHEIILAPQGMLSGKGSIFVYLNEMTFRVGQGSSSITKVEAKVRIPRLHYVEPICFEAGRPMEFFACGSNLHQAKFRFLISFSGQYLAYDNCIIVPHWGVGQDTDCSVKHQLYKIYIAHTEPDLFGPAFIEVENESGLSNFLPILIGNNEVCSEVKRVQQKSDAHCCSPSDACKGSVFRQTTISEFILDIAWLLREPASENVCHRLTSSQIQRLNCLFSHLLQNECFSILARILQYAEILINDVELKRLVSEISDADMRLFQKNINCARDTLRRKSERGSSSTPDSANSAQKGDYVLKNFSGDSPVAVPITNQDLEGRGDLKLPKRTEVVPLLDKQIVMNVNPIEQWPRKSCGRIFSGKLNNARPLFVVIATAVVCFGMCAVLYHPRQVGEFIVTVRRCVFDGRLGL